MIFVVKTSTIYNCSLERAFKTPLLCDLAKVHTGMGIIPKVTHTTNGEKWGKVKSRKRVHVAKFFLHKGGFALICKILEKSENEYWKIQINSFQFWVLGLHKFVGEWKTTEIEDKKILIEYSYTLHANSPLFYPVAWIFVKLYWKKYMDQVLENVRKMACDKEPYLFDEM